MPPSRRCTVPAPRVGSLAGPVRRLLPFVVSCARFARAQRAVAALEYAILVAVIALAIAAVLALLGDDLVSAVNGIGDRLVTNLANVGT